ncbi:MAG: SRPBCC family protein, partial [Candidatus Omnitrophota bacterium]
TYPTFVNFYTTKSIIENNDSRIVVTIGYRLFGFPIYWTGVGEKIKYHSINYTQTKGFLMGMKAHWNFISLGDKTKVIIDVELRSSIRFLNWIIKKRIKKIIDDILLDLKNAVEKEKIKCIQ